MNIQEHQNVMQSRFREAILQKLKPNQREIVERIRSALRGQPLEDVLRRISGGSSTPGATISEEDLVIGVSKLNANLFLGDLKEFIAAIKSPQDGRVSLADTIQLIGSNQ